MSWARSQGCRRVYNSIPATNDLALSFLQDNGWWVEAVRSGLEAADAIRGNL
jgi:murein L,D-transpeptidase YcbB/YkuD